MLYPLSYGRAVQLPFFCITLAVVPKTARRRKGFCDSGVAFQGASDVDQTFHFCGLLDQPLAFSLICLARRSISSAFFTIARERTVVASVLSISAFSCEARL